jgi:hypothetical protein
MSSTFQSVGFERLYIKGVLWDLDTFKGAKGDDVTSTVKGPPGNDGVDNGIEFNTINTTATSQSITLPDPSTVSYNGLVVKSNGIFPESAFYLAIPVKTHLGVTVGNIYNNRIPQSMRFSKNETTWVV